MKNITPILFLALFFCVSAGTASAQMNNKPFSFNTPSGGVGMSIGGKQAILNEKIYGVTPSNMLRAPDGSLLDVARGTGDTAVVSVPGGSVIPSYHGTSWKDGNTAMAVGVFDAYFVPHANSSSGYVVSGQQSANLVNTWTARVITGTPVSYAPDSSVDTWTGMVYTPN